jgi:hypothetical protein
MLPTFWDGLLLAEHEELVRLRNDRNEQSRHCCNARKGKSEKSRMDNATDHKLFELS